MTNATDLEAVAKAAGVSEEVLKIWRRGRLTDAALIDMFKLVLPKLKPTSNGEEYEQDQ